jgi:hypothetical protein
MYALNLSTHLLEGSMREICKDGDLKEEGKIYVEKGWMKI